MKLHFVGFACVAFMALMPNPGIAAADDKESEQLIDQLVNVSEPGFGYSVYFAGGEFLPYENTAEMGTLVIGLSRAARSERAAQACCEGGRRGADASQAYG